MWDTIMEIIATIADDEHDYHRCGMPLPTADQQDGTFDKDDCLREVPDPEAWSW